MKTKQAFTLIELMVVIAIISILALLTVPNFTSATRRARDAKEISNISNIQQALVMYRADKGYYPGGDYDGDSDSLIVLKEGGYIQELPTPARASSYYIYRCLEPLNAYHGDKCYKFILCTPKLEYRPGDKGTGNRKIGSDGYIDHENACDPNTSNDCDYYCVTSP